MDLREQLQATLGDTYRVERELAGGGMARVFVAEEKPLGRRVVAKVLRVEAAGEVSLERFRREVAFAAQLQHPHIVPMLTAGETGGLAFYLMPFIQGETLRSRLSRAGELPVSEASRILREVASALAFAHRAGVVHRDIKPDNIILESEGSLKLIDLGVVRVPGMEDAPPEDIPGTLAYMAPEMIDGEPGNQATDIYALGVTMFRAFTGEFPYGNADAISPPRRDRPIQLSALRPDLPAWLQAVLTRAVAADPTERFQDMGEFAFEMEAGPTRAPSAIARPRTLYERNPVRFWQGVAALFACAFVLALLLR